MALRDAPEPLQSITVPTDFSAGAHAALLRALTLPFARGATLRLVHVVSRGLSKSARSKAHREARAACERILSEVSGELEDPAAVRLELEILEGRDFVEIVRDARNASTDLVVLGRHGRQGVRDLFIGSVADRTVRTSEVPVLVVNRKPEHSYCRPLVAIDLEGESEGLLGTLERLLGAVRRSVRVVHAFDIPFESLVAPRISAVGESDYRRECRQNAQAKLEAFLTRTASSRLRCRGVVRAGDPRSVVLREAARHRADLIAVGTHARSGIAHALLGSVAEWILSASPCDVLVVRPRRFAFELP